MPILVVIIIFVVALAGGGAGGFFAKQQMGKGGVESQDDAGYADDGEDQTIEDKADAQGDEKETAKKKSKSKSDDYDDVEMDVNVNYYKFSRQFIVPVINDDGLKSVVLLDLNLEMDESAAEAFYVREPKLRDVLMEELLDLANEGRFNGRLTNRRNLQLVRMDLLNAVQDVSGGEIRDVLILDIMRQDV